MRVLSLTGGGSRGVFTASALLTLEKKIIESGNKNFSFHQHCSLIAGTSIGGILALGIAAGIPIENILQTFLSKASYIFPCSPLKYFKRKAFYDHNRVAQVVTELFLNHNIDIKTPISKLACPVMLVSFCETTNNVALIHSESEQYKDWNILDAAMATSAAPIYFNAFLRKDNENKIMRYIDGGIIGNRPEYFVIKQYENMYGMEGIKISFDNDNPLRILSVGTSYPSNRPQWSDVPIRNILSSSNNIVSFILDAQMQTSEWLLERYENKISHIRFDSAHTGNIGMDTRNKKELKKLISLGQQCIPDSFNEPSLNAWISSFTRNT